MPATIAQSLCGAKPAAARAQARKAATAPGARIVAAATSQGSAKLFGNSFLQGKAIASASGASLVTSRNDTASRRGKVSRVVTVAAGDEEPAFAAWNSGAAVKKRTDLKKIMILGAGPIVIGQACEFDYSGSQACKALKAEGYEIVLVNSNPATIMTDPGTADRTYVGPMTPEYCADIIAKEKPDALLPTMGGQTALNLAKALAEGGVLDEHNVELIGAKLDAINKAEDRELFKQAMDRIGCNMTKSATATTLEQARKIREDINSWPIIIRPAFTLGGTGGGIAYNQEEFEMIVQSGINASSTNQVLVEQSLLGWKEYELEVMRDLADNVVIICSIENIDPMGVHTGDSITLAPAQTLTDKEYQRLRDQSIAIIREIGVECGGSNVQFAVNPVDGEVMVIEMNPRVSRSSALASKATGFPIAKFAAKLAVGYTLDQIANDITRKTPASFEPSIDYVVTKIPRFAFEKFPGSSPLLTTQMKSVGEAMAMGRTFQESLQKALRSLETGLDGFSIPKGGDDLPDNMDDLEYYLRTPTPERMIAIRKAFQLGASVEDVLEMTNMDTWFVSQLKEIVDVEVWMGSQTLEGLSTDDWTEIKRRGFSDIQIARALSDEGITEFDVRDVRKGAGVVPAMKRVDTCAAEFEADTPYMYSSYDGGCEANSSSAKKVLILGGGPNRIGQGIEFDYCCCHAAYSLHDAGFETIMMNSNPETVSTDYDTSDRLYFEPLTVEDVLNVIDVERPDGIIVQFGGQTPLKLANPINDYLQAKQIPTASGEGVVKIWGTSPDSIDLAEDRERFEALLRELDIKQPAGGIARSGEEAIGIAGDLGYPVMVRPSYVLGGRAMEIVYNESQIERYITTAVKVDPSQPVLVDKYLGGATELDVDALADVHGNVVIGGIMEHIELAGVHSGDSACSIPTQTISAEALAKIRENSIKLAKRLNVVGLINIQWAVYNGEPYIIEANPRASRTVPFVAKAVGHPMATYASLLMSGQSLEQIGLTEEPVPKHVAVKEAVLPFDKFPGADTLLGPEMRSTGEVMGIDMSFAAAYAKAQLAATGPLAMPTKGGVFIAMNDDSKEGIKPIAKQFAALGFKIYSTKGTAKALKEAGVDAKVVLKLHEGRPNIGDNLQNGDIHMMLITADLGDASDLKDGKELRRMALGCKVPIVTTLAAANATVGGIECMQKGDLVMTPLQDFF